MSPPSFMILDKILPIRASGCTCGKWRVSTSAAVPTNVTANVPFYFSISWEQQSCCKWYETWVLFVDVAVRYKDPTGSHAWARCPCLPHPSASPPSTSWMSGHYVCHMGLLGFLGSKVDLGLNFDSATFLQLCDTGPMPSPPWASASSSVRWSL